MYQSAMVYHDGYRLAVVAPAGRLYVSAVVALSSGVRVLRLPRDYRFTEPPGKPRMVRVQRVAKSFLRFGRAYGISAKAREMLREAAR